MDIKTRHRQPLWGKAQTRVPLFEHWTQPIRLIVNDHRLKPVACCYG